VAASSSQQLKASLLLNFDACPFFYSQQIQIIAKNIAAQDKKLY